MLITGATGKVGQALITRMRDDQRFADVQIRALCHNRTLPPGDRLEIVKGNIADPAVAQDAIEDVTHIVHLATCKEVPELVMDVTIKGLFWLLEAFRASAAARQFILIGGDAGIGHFFYRHDGPITEAVEHQAYPGCYALSKVLEEVMVEQYGIQYDMNWTCLRAPWIMEKDDFRHSLSFGDDVFGGPDWKTMVTPEIAERCRRDGAIPLVRDADGNPLKRNFIHVEDLAEAILLAIDHPAASQRLYNICMTEPIDYGEVAAYLETTRGLGSIDIPSAFQSTWLDNSRARFELGWRPRYDLARLIDAAWSYDRAATDPRKIWYPG